MIIYPDYHSLRQEITSNKYCNMYLYHMTILQERIGVRTKTSTVARPDIFAHFSKFYRGKCIIIFCVYPIYFFGNLIQ
jgi:hypothetical protein